MIKRKVLCLMLQREMQNNCFLVHGDSNNRGRWVRNLANMLALFWVYLVVLSLLFSWCVHLPASGRVRWKSSCGIEVSLPVFRMAIVFKLSHWVNIYICLAFIYSLLLEDNDKIVNNAQCWVYSMNEDEVYWYSVFMQAEVNAFIH